MVIHYKEEFNYRSGLNTGIKCLGAHNSWLNGAAHPSMSTYLLKGYLTYWAGEGSLISHCLNIESLGNYLYHNLTPQQPCPDYPAMPHWMEAQTGAGNAKTGKKTSKS